MEKFRNVMTVKELREALDNYDDDMPVLFAYNYGDHGRTPVAEGVRVVEDDDVVWSKYHRMMRLVREYDLKSKGTVHNVVVLKATRF